MKKSILFILTATVLSLTMVVLFGCGKSEGEFEGKLINANSETVVVKADGDIEIFSTTEETVYELGDETELTAGDTVIVAYHEKGKQKLADTVTLVEAVDHTLTMEGELTDLNPTDFVLSSDSLTVTFDYDARTEIVGEKLNEGDEVKVTYKGDLSEEPYAIKVEILQEQVDDPHYEAHGIIADVADATVLLSIDSSEAHRFIYNPETEIVSDDKKMEIGDRAEITFTGDINDKPVATKIVVHHQAKKNKNVINGTLDKAEKTYMELNTGRNTYKILVNDKSQFKGAKYKKGAKATVTYTGDLKEEPLATDVYCDKTKKKDDPTKPTETKPTKTETKTETETKTDPPEPPKPVTVTVKAYIEEWDTENNNATFKVDGDEENPLKLTIENVDIPVGYFPEVGDYVMIEYDKDKLDLLDMQLIERPDPDPKTEPDRNEGGKAEEQTEATTKAPTTTKATTTKATTAATKAPETEPEAQDEGEEQ